MERFDQELAYHNLSLAELQGERGAGLCKEETCGIPCSRASTVLGTNAHAQPLAAHQTALFSRPPGPTAAPAMARSCYTVD